MIFIRSFLYLLGQIISAVVICMAALPVLWLPARIRFRIILQWARFNIWTLRHLCGIIYRVHGEENIPGEPSVVLSNHQSAWETLAFQLIFPMQSYLLKRNLLWIPFFGWGLAMNRPIAIDRSRKIRALDTLIKQGVIRLREGRWLIIFPEGTRQSTMKTGKFQGGGAMIAARSGNPIVPVAHNAGLFWPKNSFLKYPGTIDVVIGPAIHSTGRRARELNEEAESLINLNLEKLPRNR